MVWPPHYLRIISTHILTLYPYQRVEMKPRSMLPKPHSAKLFCVL